MLEGQIVEGTHEKMISREVFLKINNLLKESRYGIPHERENEQLPLKAFMKCFNCGTSITGYINKKKKLYYYKCPTKGCNCSKNAVQLGNVFLKELETLNIDQKYHEPILFHFAHLLSKNDKENETTLKELNEKLKEASKKVENIEEKYYALNEMPEEAYLRLKCKIQKEKEEIQKEMEKYAEKSSNWVEKLKTVLNLLPFPSQMWEFSEVKLKEKIQKLIYPMGMRFHKEKEAVLTEKVNELYSRLALSSRAFNEKGELSSPFLFTSSLCAEREGFEPPDLLQSPVFKTGAIDRSAISPLQK